MTEIINNGFYNVDLLGPQERVNFINDAIAAAFLIKCESKYKKSFSRTLDDTLKISHFNDISTIHDFKISMVDRYMYNQRKLPKGINDNEISVINDNWQFLWIYVNDESFNFLIKKYKLKLKKI